MEQTVIGKDGHSESYEAEGPHTQWHRVVRKEHAPSNGIRGKGRWIG